MAIPETKLQNNSSRAANNSESLEKGKGASGDNATNAGNGLVKLKRFTGRINAKRAIGAFVLFLAFIGMISIVRLTVLSIETAAEKKALAERERFESLVMPVAAIDPPTFEKIENINNYTVLKSSAILAIDLNKNNLKIADDGRIVLTEDMITDASNAIFGDNVKLNHLTFDINENLFEYDSIKKCYYFPGTGHVTKYLPNVHNVSKKGGDTVVLVEYQPIGVVNGEENIMRYYIFKGEKGKEKLKSIKPAQVTTTVSKSS